MNPGELRHRITIQRSKKTTGENFVTKTEYQDIKRVWARVNNLYGKEYWKAREYGAESTVEFTIRTAAVADITVRDRVVFGGEVYNIMSIDNVLYRGEYTKIKVIAVEREVSV